MTITIDTNDSIISNDNTVTVESKPKRTADQASQDRIDFHKNESAKKAARLVELEAAGKKDSKAYTRCLNALAKNDAFTAELQAQLDSRRQERAAKAA